jgi:mono/diheme cytochrome c family protein
LQARIAAIALLLVTVGACKSPPVRRHFMPEASASRGKAIIARVGCTACHAIPGIDWPKGRVGPNLENFADGTLIAGKVPNRPDMLAAYVRDAPALVPGSGMPAMPLTQEESRDVAAYLYTLGA